MDRPTECGAMPSSCVATGQEVCGGGGHSLDGIDRDKRDEAKEENERKEGRKGRMGFRKRDRDCR